MNDTRKNILNTIIESHETSYGFRTVIVQLHISSGDANFQINVLNRPNCFIFIIIFKVESYNKVKTSKAKQDHIHQMCTMKRIEERSDTNI